MAAALTWECMIFFHLLFNVLWTSRPGMGKGSFFVDSIAVPLFVDWLILPNPKIFFEYEVIGHSLR